MSLPTDPIKLLLIEDDVDVATGIGAYLTARGVDVDFAYTAAQARALAESTCFDVLVLDVNLPDRDGYALCRVLKSELGLQQPVIFLTAQGSLDDKLAGFAAGAVDYVVKPFAPAELLARVQAIAAHIPAADGAKLRVGDYVLDLRRNLLHCGATHLSLHATGATILRRLMQAYPGSVTKQELCARLWPIDVPDSDPLRAHVYQLRRSLQERFGQALIATVRGVGYRFDLDGDAAST